MTEPKSRMTAMRQRALEAFSDGPALQDLSGFSTTALWEVARVQLKRGNPYSLAVVLVELHRRCPPVPGGRPISLAYHVSDTPAPDPCVLPDVSDTQEPKPKTVSETIPGIAGGASDTPLNHGAKLDDEAHDRLVGLVAEVERSAS